jgi:hypothetical protein
MINVTVSRAVEKGKPGEGIEVGGTEVQALVWVDVGHRVPVGILVGVDVGGDGVGVYAVRMISFWLVYIVYFESNLFKVRRSAGDIP